jgi:hypothetical protein
MIFHDHPVPLGPGFDNSTIQQYGRLEIESKQPAEACLSTPKLQR